MNVLAFFFGNLPLQALAGTISLPLGLRAKVPVSSF
jgi:hypothetical protein